MERVKVLGILGGIGSGKSTIGAMFADLGAVVLDADRIAHECLTHDDVKESIRQRFGATVFDGDAIDRAALGKRVFDSNAERRALESIVHPCVRESIERRLQQARNDPRVPLVVLDVPLLLESPLNHACDARVFVDAPRDERLRRVMTTRGWDETELDRRERAQIALDAKRRAADHVIANSGPLDAVRSAVQAVFAAVTRDRAPSESDPSPGAR